MTRTADPSPAPPSTELRRMLNKVPEITLHFWVIKVLATTVGETAADFLSVDLNFGLTATSWVMGGLLIAVLTAQLRARRYLPTLYWLTVVLISIVGTLVTDNLVDNLGVSLATTTTVFAVLLAATFAAWYASERTLSIHTVHTTRREAFYWTAILFTFALARPPATCSPRVSTPASPSACCCSALRSSRSGSGTPGSSSARCSASGSPTS